MATDLVKIVVYVPLAHAQAVRDAMANANCGHIGNYNSCTFSVRGTGRFRPLKGSKPFIGEAPKDDGQQNDKQEAGKIETVEEERIETICPRDHLTQALAAIREVHPYEEPAIDVYPLENLT